MNRIIRAFAAFIVSICLILAPSIQYANAASSWGISSAISSGARTIVTATKSGYKSAVNIMPTGARFGLRLIRIGNTAALLYAAAQLANDGVDFVLDPENNTIKYKVNPDYDLLYKVSLDGATAWHSTKEAACAAGLAAFNAANAPHIFINKGVYSTGSSCQYEHPVFGNGYANLMSKVPDAINKSMSVATAANQILKNAQNGDTAAQALAKDAAVEMVVAGDFDADLLSGAVPQSDNKPLIPAVPGNQNGNVTHGSDIGSQDGMSGATPGQQSDAAKDAADAAAKAAAAAKDAAKDAAQAAADAADKAEDLINSGADAAEKAAADAAAKSAAQAAKDAAASAAAAGERAAATAAAAERAAAAATAAAKAAAEKAAKDLADAIAAGEQAAIDAAKAATEAAEKELAEAKEKQAAAEKAAEKAKAEAAKPFELPPFCSWAAPVCDFIDWVKADPQLEEPEDTRPEIQDLTKYDTVDISQKYVTATGQCPPAADLNINFGVVKLSYEPLCIILDKLSGVIVAVAYISVGFMIIRTV